MSDRAAHHEMVSPLPEGRTYTLELRPLLGDCAPSGRMRLDAIARWLQDIAYADIEDAGVADRALWVVRRTRVEVSRFPRFGERFAVRTFCSAVGRMWSERRTTISALGDVGGQRATNGEVPIVEAVALWIHLDPVRRVPSLLTESELEIYGSAAGERRVHHRLHHPKPNGAAPARTWTFRETDCDLADHVNNAAYWETLEEELLERERAAGEESGALTAEIEFRTPAQPGAVIVLADGRYRWLVDDTGEVYASTVLTNAATASGST